MSKHVHGYLTKYALTEGVREVDDAVPLEDGYVRGAGPWGFFVKDGKDFFRTREDAEAAAKAMAVCKIASLEKQIAKLRKLAEAPKWAKKEA